MSASVFRGSTGSDRLVAPAALLLAALLAYQGSFGVPFFFDDVAAITNNPTIRNLWRIGDVLSPPGNGEGMMGRPVVNLSLALNYALGGTNVAGYHVFNLIVHAISTLALFGLVRRALLQPVLRPRFGAASRWLAFIVALLWTVHPLQTESVTCVIQRTELLVGMFYLLTLYGFIRSVEDRASRTWPWLTFAVCALGMASKEVMVSAPLMVVLYDRTFVSGTFRQAWAERRLLYLGLAATWLILAGLLVGMGGTRGVAAGFGLGVSWWSYALKQCEAIVTYLALSLWPHPLVVDYGTGVINEPSQVLIQIVVVSALIVAMLVTLKRRPVEGFVLFWVCAILAPSSSVVPLVSQTMAEHRMYLPLAAIMSLASIATYRVVGMRATRIAGAIAAAMCVSTISRNHTMQDEVRLWNDTVAKVPDNSRAHGSLGLALSSRGDARDAIPRFKKALELDPGSVATEQNLGNAHFRLGEFDEAASHFRRAVKLDPKFASAYNSLGATLWELHDVEGSLQSYRTALAIDPNHSSTHQNAARALFMLGRFQEAAVHYEHVQRQNPDSATAHYDLGLALARAGDIDRAAGHFSAALRLKPSAVSYYNYARFLANAGRTTEAIASLETALRLQPDFNEARRELDRLLTLIP